MERGDWRSGQGTGEEGNRLLDFCFSSPFNAFYCSQASEPSVPAPFPPPTWLCFFGIASRVQACLSSTCLPSRWHFLLLTAHLQRTFLCLLPLTFIPCLLVLLTLTVVRLGDGFGLSLTLVILPPALDKDLPKVAHSHLCHIATKNGCFMMMYSVDAKLVFFFFLYVFT